MTEKANYIKSFNITNMWGRIDIEWDNIFEDVNILVGINGCGKTTLLNLIAEYYSGIKPKKDIAESVNGNEINIPITYIHSFDVPSNTKRRNESMLLQDLKHIINQNGEGSSFFDYRMKMLNYPDKAETIQKRINNFFSLVNSFFEDTHKKIQIDPQNNTLIFRVSGTEKVLKTSDGRIFMTSDNKRFITAPKKVQLAQLSSGEKQLLLILTTVFLQEEHPNVLLLDEPEISLHLNWQDRLIGTIRSLNPNCQLILTTHSPNIIANGWADKVVFVQDLEKK